jgi:GNAT superfamily N-acetyltransferase
MANLAVVSHARRRGVGQRLVKGVEVYVAKWGFKVRLRQDQVYLVFQFHLEGLLETSQTFNTMYAVLVLNTKH